MKRHRLKIRKCLAMGFLLFALSVCAQGYPIRGQSIYGKHLHFDGTIAGMRLKFLGLTVHYVTVNI